MMVKSTTMKTERWGLPKRLTKMAELSVTMMLGDVRFDPESLERVKGLEEPVIFTVTHLSDWDITALVIALGKEANIRAKIVQASSHYSWRDSPLEALGTALAGSDNFLTISHGSGKDKERGLFRRDDYKPMVEAMNEGYSMIMAAYHDREQVGFNQRKATLPEKGGGGVIYLARITGRPVIPVVVNMEQKWRGKAVIKVGKEIIIGENEILRDGSDKMMVALAEMLPKSKKGHWEKDD